MKPSFIALSFLFAFIASSAKAQFVLDAQGHPLFNGGSYYILPHIWGPLGGGMILAKTGNETCPLSVKPSPFEVDKGLPWRIQTLVRPTFLLANQPLFISSVEGTVPSCVNSPSKWTIVEGEDETLSVKITGYENTVKGMFQIQQYRSRFYKIVFCPSNGDSCKDVGLSANGLVLTENSPLGIVFSKAESSEVSKQRINNVLEA